MNDFIFIAPSRVIQLTSKCDEYTGSSSLALKVNVYLEDYRLYKSNFRPHGQEEPITFCEQTILKTQAFATVLDNGFKKSYFCGNLFTMSKHFVGDVE